MRYTRQGQACTAGSRVYIHEKIYDKVLEGAVDKLSKLKMGNALDETSDIGAIISEEQLKRTLYYMDIAKKILQQRFYMEEINQKGESIKMVFIMSQHYFRDYL